MNGHYISFKDENNEGNEILRVFPAELRRQYQPESTERVMSVGEFKVQVMHMVYKITDCIVHLRTKDGPICLSDAISVILDEHEAVTATFMPCNVTQTIATDNIDAIKKMVYYFYPNIANTSKYGVHDLIELDMNTVNVRPRPTRAARPRGIPQVTAIPVDDG